MRSVFAVCLTMTGLFVADVSAQCVSDQGCVELNQGRYPNVGPGCAPAPQRQIKYVPCYDCQSCGPESAPESAPAQPEGAFLRNLGNGEVSGEVNSLGLSGFKLRFPELTLELPTIQFPSLVRYRRNPEMLVESSRAPFVRGDNVLEFNQVRRRDELPESAPATDPETAPGCVPQYRYRCDDGCVSDSDNRVEQLSENVAQLQGVVEQLIRLQTQQAQAERAEPAIIQPTSHNQQTRFIPQAYQAPPVSNDSAFAQKCREVDELKRQIAELQGVCKQLIHKQESTAGTSQIRTITYRPVPVEQPTPKPVARPFANPTAFELSLQPESLFSDSFKLK